MPGRSVPEEHLYKVVDALDAVAAEIGKTVPQVALNWLLQRPTVSSVIIGARNEEQLRQNLGAAGWNLTREQVGRWIRQALSSRCIPTGTSASSSRGGIRCQCKNCERGAAHSLLTAFVF